MNGNWRKTSQGSLTAGVILIGIGFLFLLTNFKIVPALHRLWPVFLIIVGIAIILGGKRKSEEKPPSSP